MKEVEGGLTNRFLQAIGNSKFIRDYNVGITVFLGIITIAVLVLLVINITKISTSVGNPMLRREAIVGTSICLVCLALIGGIDLVFAIVLNFVFGS